VTVERGRADAECAKDAIEDDGRTADTGSER
jgi:hypothetical protein